MSDREAELRTAKETRSPIEQLRRAQPSHPRLPKRLRVHLQVVEPPHRATKDIAARLHRGFPCTWIDVESGDDRRELGIDVTSFIVTNRTARPVDELQILLERVWDARCPSLLIGERLQCK